MEPATVEIIVNAIVGLATVVLTAIVAPLLLKQVKVADGKLSDQQRAVLYPILLNAISYGQAKAIGDPQAAALSVAALQEHVVGIAAGFTRQHAGETLDELGVTDEALRRMLLARLQQAIAAGHAAIGGISDQKAALIGQPKAPASN